MTFCCYAEIIKETERKVILVYVLRELDVHNGGEDKAREWEAARPSLNLTQMHSGLQIHYRLPKPALATIPSTKAPFNTVGFCVLVRLPRATEPTVDMHIIIVTCDIYVL